MEGRNRQAEELGDHAMAAEGAAGHRREEGGERSLVMFRKQGKLDWLTDRV